MKNFWLFKIRRNAYDLLLNLVRSNFKMRYQNSVLGILWVLIKPYFTFFVLYAIRLSSSSGKIENYGIYLLIGIVTYTYFSEMVTFGQMSLLDRAGIILKINFPREIAVLSSIMNALINLLINLVFILIIVVVTGIDLSILGLIYAMFIFAIIFIFCFAFALITSILTVRFRDLRNIFDLAIFLLYWGSPIFFIPEFDGREGIGKLLMNYNPIGYFINQVRAGFGIYGEINITSTMMYFAGAVILLLIARWFFARNIKKVTEYF